MELKRSQTFDFIQKYSYTFDPNVANKNDCQETENSHDFKEKNNIT